MDSRLLLIKTIQDYYETTKIDIGQCLKNYQYGAANYLLGKEQAYKEILDLLYQIKENKIPFELN